jgi:hypothetical protein
VRTKLRHRRKIAQPVVRKLLVDVRVDADVGDVGIDERVSVGGRILRRFDADDALRAGLVLDHDRLAERGLQLLSKPARNEIRLSARRVRRDQLDRLRRPGLAECERRCKRERRKKNRDVPHFFAH